MNYRYINYQFIIILITAPLGFATLMVGFFVSDGSGWLLFGCVNIILLIVCVRIEIRDRKRDRRYEGELKDGMKHGQGSYHWANGDKYEGEWKDEKMNGQGTHTNKYGEKYEGEFKDGLYDGQGTLTFPKGYKYVGEFKDGKRHGHGKHILSDGEKYVGEFKDGLKSGQGTLTLSSGNKYVGEFKDMAEGYSKIWNGKEFDPKGEIINYIENGKKISIAQINIKKFLSDNNLTWLPNGHLRDENFEEYELEEERGDFIVYKPEGMRGKRAYIKTDGKNYLAWSGPIKIADKSKFLRGDLEKAKEESHVQEQEVENIEVKQEKESESSDANLDISSMLDKLTKLYEEGKLTEEEFKKKSDDLVSQI